MKNSRGKRSFIPLHKTRPDSPVPTLQGLGDPNQTSASEVRRGTLRFLPPLEIRTSSIAGPSGVPRDVSQLYSIPDFSEAP